MISPDTPFILDKYKKFFFIIFTISCKQDVKGQKLLFSQLQLTVLQPELTNQKTFFILQLKEWNIQKMLDLVRQF